MTSAGAILVLMGTGGLLGVSDIRDLVDQLGVRPTKRLGQNFVVDANTVRRIARMADVNETDVVLEVGPGLGSLTLALLEQGAQVTAVEIDRVLAEALPTTVAARLPAHAADLRVLHADVLDVPALPGPDPTALVANLPYNVAVPILVELLSSLESLRSGLVMVQTEVAERIVAGPGSRTYGVPSLKVAWHAEARWAGRVPRSVFWPVPHVDSALVRLERRSPPAGADRHEVYSVVDAAFGQRRKMLRTSLARLAGSAGAAEDALRSVGVAPTARAEEVDLAAFARIASALPHR